MRKGVGFRDQGLEKKTNHYTLITNPLNFGFSSILILIFVVIIIFIVWGISKSVKNMALRDAQFAAATPSPKPASNCNGTDPNDPCDRGECPFKHKDASGKEVCVNTL